MKYILLFFISCSMLACKAKVEAGKQGSLPDKNEKVSEQIEENVMTVDMQKNMHVVRLIQSFPTFGMKVKCVLSIEENRVVMTCKPGEKTFDEIVTFLNHEVGIDSVIKGGNCPPQ